MKKKFLLGLLSLTASLAASFGQSAIFLDNYNTTGPYITYGSGGLPINGQSGPVAAGGQKVIGNPSGTSPWKVGFYYALGNVTGSISSDPTGIFNPTTLGGGLVLATGAGSTAGINDSLTPLGTGAFLTGAFWAVPGTSGFGGETITLMLIVYSGTTYDASLYRGHSTAFTMITSASTSSTPSQVGKSMPAFSIPGPVPEPSVLTLSGIGAAALILFRCKKA